MTQLNLDDMKGTHWLELVKTIEAGGSFAPWHYMNEVSFEDTLHYDYQMLFVMAVSQTSCPRDPNREPKKDPWDVPDIDAIFRRHNWKPSNCIFYKRRK